MTATRPKRPLMKRLALFGLFAFLVMIPLGWGFLEWTTRAEFCSSCHIMEPYVKSWAQSSHSKVPCVDCHYEPGILETATGKFKAINQVVKYVTGTEGTKPWAEVSDNSCLRSGCHSTRVLQGQVNYQIGRTSIAFDHGPHLLEMRLSKKLRCTSCHSQIVQGEHLTVTATTCLLCHFKGAEEDPKLAKCTTCHVPPKEAIKLGDAGSFLHAEYLARGVACDSCHANVTQGTGEVPKRRCGSCHAVQEHLERIGDREFMHKKHVTEHKVDCLECHTEMTHRLRDRQAPAGGTCAECHASGHGKAEAFYRGVGGRTAADTPNPMELARVTCTGCHLQLGAKPVEGAAVAAKEVACISCHGPKYEGMLGRWQTAFVSASASLSAELVAARAAAAEKAAGDTALAKSLEDAAHDVALVKGDGARGAHNPWFARKLLDGADGRVRAAWAKLDPSRPAAPAALAPRFPTKLDCAKVCHLGIDEQPIRLEGTRFQHEKHLASGKLDCDQCHSTAEHGKTLVAKADCASCHHGEKAPAGRECASCHVEADRFLRGVGDDGEQGAQVMAKVTCVECHGAAVAKPVREAVQANCNVCHKEKYAATVAEWTKDSDEWFAEAEGRMAKIRARADAGKTTPAKAAAADAILTKVRRSVPSHNIVQFEELKESFDEAAGAAEK